MLHLEIDLVYVKIKIMSTIFLLPTKLPLVLLNQASGQRLKVIIIIWLAPVFKRTSNPKELEQRMIVKTDINTKLQHHN